MNKNVLGVLFVSLLFLVAFSISTLQADDDDDENFGRTGIIDSRPGGVIGSWVIDGITYTADGSTIIDENHGPLSVGSCTEISYLSASNLTAIKIESQEALKCNIGDGYVQTYGILQSFPVGNIGDWVIDNVTYSADNSTQFDEEHGSFSAGICVEVKYLPAPLKALEIETENSYKCDDNTSSDYTEIKGVLDTFPSDLVGDWVVDGIAYHASLGTQFEQEHGPFFAGGCVEVKYVSSTNDSIEVSTTGVDDCQGSSSSPESKFYGLIEVIPSGNIGTWQIKGLSFESNALTVLEQDADLFAIGVCAEVEYYDNGGINQASEIKTEDAYHCNGGTYTNKAYGTLDIFPDSLYGSWVIAGVTYVSTPSTTGLSQENGSFAIDTCTKVKYFTQDGINYAVEIETEDSNDCNDGNPLPGTSKVYATVGSFPPAPHIGSWQIGEEPYEATVTTEFEEKTGAFAIGACVQAEYLVIDSIKTLVEVESENSYKCQAGAGSEMSSYGVVELLPAIVDLTGNWQVSNIVYQADNSTEFSQDHGFFSIGSYVEVHYIISGTIKLATTIETHVSPGAGSNTIVGTVDTHDSNDDWGDWIIDGVTYKADPAIEVNDTTSTSPRGSKIASSQTSLFLGETVLVNSYQNNGALYITSITIAQQSYLPIISKP